MIWTAWNNGSHSRTGAGYGFRMSPEDRDKNFRRDWQTVIVELPLRAGGFGTVEVSVDNQSFWGDCEELRNKEIGQWLRRERHAPWPMRHPPKFQVEKSRRQAFQSDRLDRRALIPQAESLSLQFDRGRCTYA